MKEGELTLSERVELEEERDDLSKLKIRPDGLRLMKELLFEIDSLKTKIEQLSNNEENILDCKE